MERFDKWNQLNQSKGKLSSNEVRILMLVLNAYNMEWQYLSQSKIAFELGLTDRTVRNTLKSLERKELIFITETDNKISFKPTHLVNPNIEQINNLLSENIVANCDNDSENIRKKFPNDDTNIRKKIPNDIRKNLPNEHTEKISYNIIDNKNKKEKNTMLNNNTNLDYIDNLESMYNNCIPNGEALNNSDSFSDLNKGEISQSNESQKEAAGAIVSSKAGNHTIDNPKTQQGANEAANNTFTQSKVRNESEWQHRNKSHHCWEQTFDICRKSIGIDGYLALMREIFKDWATDSTTANKRLAETMEIHLGKFGIEIPKKKSKTPIQKHTINPNATIREKVEALDIITPNRNPNFFGTLLKGAQFKSSAFSTLSKVCEFQQTHYYHFAEFDKIVETAKSTLANEELTDAQKKLADATIKAIQKNAKAPNMRHRTITNKNADTDTQTTTAA